MRPRFPSWSGLDALIADERVPRVLARDRGQAGASSASRSSRRSRVASTSRARSELLDEIEALKAKSEALTLRIDQSIAEIPAAHAPVDPGLQAAPRTRSWSGWTGLEHRYRHAHRPVLALLGAAAFDQIGVALAARRRGSGQPVRAT